MHFLYCSYFMQDLAKYSNKIQRKVNWFMKEIIIGILAGIVSGLGMGGGTILILFLTLFANIDQHTAQATNIIFFVPTALSAILIFIKDNKINFKLGIPICIIGVIGAILGAIISSNMEVRNA